MAIDPARAKSLFLNASDLADPAERAAYLGRECGEDAELRDRVEALLRANEGSPLPPPASEVATIESASGGPATEAMGIHTPNPDAEPSPISITAEYRGTPAPNALIAGRYTLQEKIGEGGMGEVWVAKQSEPVKRKVALKLIKPGMDSRAVLQRFEQERQALAMMDHPNIAKVLDAGLTPNGQPFFAMELVNGLPLNKFCDEAKLATKDRLELFVTICQAVQHAHQKGIVHRDLKPANILITIIDGKPVPKVIDFGVAKATAGKLTDESLSTQFGAIVGTLEYMSPEQAGFSGEDIDTRADIYSLGVILYEMLTGLRPIDARRLKKAALTEMIRIIREEEPSKPSTRLSTDEALPSMAALRQVEPRKLMALLRGELDWVVMKCLEKHRDRRYETASGLARDVRRYLADEAVEARPPSAGYRMGKFLKRNKGPVLAASFVLLALVAGFVGTALGLYRADRARQAEAKQRKIAVEEKNKAEASEALAEEQRSRAEQREEQAIDAVKKFRDAVANNPELKNNPALESLRKTLLKQPLAFFKSLRDRLQADCDTRPESLARLATACFDLASLTAEIGDQQDALIAYREAMAIQQRLADADSTSARYQSDLAYSYNDIAALLEATGKPAQAEALKAYESASAILRRLADADPDAAEFQDRLAYTHNSIGVLLDATGKPDAALKEYELALAIRRKLADSAPTATEFQRQLAGLHYNLGMVLDTTGKPAQALKAYEAALAIRQKLADANPTVTRFQSELAASHNGLGMVLSDAGRPDEASKAYKAAMAIRERLAREHPESPDFACELGGLLNNLAMIDLSARRFDEARDRLRQAVVWQKKALASNPSNPTYRQFLTNHLANLIKAARGLGDSECLAEAKRELATLRDSDPAMVALDARLSAILHADQAPKDQAERLRLAQRAYDKALHATAARLGSEALAADPKLGDDRQAGHRYQAARAAALAGCGKGKDDPAPDEAAKAKLRSQALDWLKAELVVWAKLVESGPSQAKPFIAQTLKHWQEDTDLTGIRDPRELAKLPDDERAALKQLWDDVNALLTKVGDGK